MTLFDYLTDYQEPIAEQKYFDGKLDEFLADIVPQLTYQQLDRMCCALEVEMRERMDGFNKRYGQNSLPF